MADFLMPNDFIVFAGVVSFALVMGTTLAASILIPPYEIPPMEVRCSTTPTTDVVHGATHSRDNMAGNVLILNANVISNRQSRTSIRS